jgi:hypothetical protein
MSGRLTGRSHVAVRQAIEQTIIEQKESDGTE